MAGAVSATSALGIAVAAAAAGCSSQGTWLALLEAGIAPHTLEDTFPGILKVFAAAVSAGGKTSLLSLEENQGAISVILSPTHFSFPDIIVSLSSSAFTESQHGQGWKGPLWVTQPNPLCQSRVTQSRLHSTAARGVGISPEKETPQPPWAAWARAPAPSEGRSSSSGSAGASQASVCARCLLTCRWAPLQRAWPQGIISDIE